ncbi:MAG: hypothetical protein KC656_25640, partial [Myxococcales bacterium]|nr:hypothetical protein [Myxococcales bacterium]
MRASLLGLGLVLGFALACGGGSTPAIQTISQWPCPDCEVTDVDVRGPIAYIAGGKKGGLVIVDLSDPSAPKELARMPVEGSAISVRVDGTTAYLGVFGKGGLVTFDVSDPTAPKQLGQHGGGAYFVEKKGDYVFVPGTVYDVSDPSKPERVAALPGSNGNGAWLEGDTLYVGASTNGFRMVDISDPKAPKLLGEMESKYAKDAAVKGDFVFVPAQNDKVVQ